jgi:hypothetical protein
MKHGWKVFIEHYKSKTHWYIKYITWTIIVIVLLAILVQILKEIGLIPAQKIFDFFSQWSLILSASATLLLASIAFWSILDIRYGRILDKKERRLNEIIEWATETGAYILKIGIPQKEEKIKSVINTSSIAQLYLKSRFDMSEDLSPLRMKSVYINEISKIEPDIQELINTSILYLRNKLRLTHKYLENIDIIKKKNGTIKAAINVAKNEYKFYSSIIDLIQKIGKTQLKDIS